MPGRPMTAARTEPPAMTSARSAGDRAAAARSETPRREPPSDTRCLLRRLAPTDLPALLAIERQSFEYPWSADDFRRALAHCRVRGLAAIRGNRFVGYLIYAIRRSDLRLLSMAVAPAARGRGVGRRLAMALLDRLRAHGRRRVSLLVRDRNLPAQLFFRGLRFRAVKVLRQYLDNGEDAYLMRYQPCDAGGRVIRRILAGDARAAPESPKES